MGSGVDEYHKDIEVLDAIIEKLSDAIKQTYTHQSQWEHTDYEMKQSCRRMMAIRGDLRELKDKIRMDLGES